MVKKYVLNVFARIYGRTARVMFITPNTLVSNWLRICSSVVFSNHPNCPYPALFTSMSIWPNCLIVASTAADTLALSVTSNESVSTFGFVPNSFSTFSLLREVATTRPPAQGSFGNG
ncbi:hypothetical protein GPJ56_006814 [Histomonas meleagridis]|nr:hypothetical protein GPJ56_006814 [Histomonas meleagridis]